MNVHESFENYTTVLDGVPCYFAGLPGYPRNFSRDTLLAGIIATDHHLLDNQLVMSSLHQGKKYDRLTGEEPGKIHHEYPGVVVHEPYESTYNACDTSALYLTGLEFLKHLNKRESADFQATHGSSIEGALEYIISHIDKDIFWEFPPPDARHYSLNITYWKDSILPSASHRLEPEYPVAYALGQFQVARGVLAAANLLNRNDLRELAHNMFQSGIAKFITSKAFCIEEDGQGRLEQSSSDEIHSLAYIPTSFASQLPIDAIRSRLDGLITDAGIACTPKDISDKLSDTYHGYVVWIYEQAMIHYGSEKFGLNDIAKITERCIPHIDSGHELLEIEPKIAPRGNTHQLWSVAAKLYFSEMSSLRQAQWL